MAAHLDKPLRHSKYVEAIGQQMTSEMYKELLCVSFPNLPREPGHTAWKQPRVPGLQDDQFPSIACLRPPCDTQDTLDTWPSILARFCK